MKDIKTENANLEADLKAAHEEIGRLKAENTGLKARLNGKGE